nr:endonuclease domain-containing protein [Modestobacter versicolor]
MRSSPWRRLYRDVYVPSDVPVDHLVRTRAAVLLLPGAVVTGRSAAVLWGVPLAGDDDPVELSLPSGARQVRVAGVRVRRRDLAPPEVTRRARLAVTTPEATAVDLAASLPDDEGVVAVDMVVGSGTADLTRVRAVAAGRTGPGSRRARTVCALADGLAGSPQETRLRMVLVRSPPPAPVAQFGVLVDGRFVARVDFGWPARRVALEYDGLWHAEPGQFRRDRERLNRLTAAGWRVVFATAADLRDPTALLARLAVELAR